MAIQIQVFIHKPDVSDDALNPDQVGRPCSTV